MQRLCRLLFPSAIPVFHPSSNVSANSSKVKTIIVLGWGGSRRKNLNKVIQFYDSIGVNVISHVTPMGSPMFVRTYFDRLIRDEIAHRVGLGEFAVHIFSNNGSWSYGSLLKAGFIPNPNCVIMDSAPFFVYKEMELSEDVKLLSQVLTSVILSGPVYQHPFITPLSKLILYPYILFSRLVTSIQSHLGVFEIFFDSISINMLLRDHSPKVPTLFLYSEGDQLVPKERVEDYINHLSNRGVPVSKYVFGNDVPHVGGFYLHSAEYGNQVRKFLLEI